MKTVSSAISPLRVDFLSPAVHGLRGQLGMTFAPGKKGQGLTCIWDRDLASDLRRLRETGCDLLVSLVEEHELGAHQIGDLHAATRALGIEVLWFPIVDVSCPREMAPFAAMIEELVDTVRAGRVVVVHCLGGKGRTGLVVASCLVALGRESEEAIAAVRKARPGTVETTAQEDFVERYRRWLAAHPRESSRLPRKPANEALRRRYRGCLLAGAAGDALGAPVEFARVSEIRADFGPGGIRNHAVAYGRAGAITDDTQMTLFTAEGLLRAWVRTSLRGIGADYAFVTAHAYSRWLHTQGEQSSLFTKADGWLVGHRELHSRRAPGNTCLAALRAAKSLGEPALNDSKGCGGVMRVAPVGLFFARILDGEALITQTFDTASALARLTHGHPSGYLAAGTFAVLVARLVKGHTLDEALDCALRALRTHVGHEETSTALEKARTLATSGTPSDDAIRALGAGWVAEEALAIAVYCALVAPDLESAVVLAVNHDGDSDSTGSIVGNLLGARDGTDAIPERWLEQLELRDVITDVADDLGTFPEWVLGESADARRKSDFYAARYPGW